MSDHQPAGRRNLVLIVCGGRDYADAEHVYRVLDRIHAERTIALLRTGGAPGADTLAEDWAVDRGVPSEVMPADWARHGRAAGPIRNGAMLEREPRPDGVIALAGGAGTADMIRQAESAGVIVWRV